MAKDTIKYITGQVNDQLVDDGFVRWPLEKLVNYLNDAQRAIVIIRPDAFVVEVEFVCVAGTKQLLPNDAQRLVDVRSNEAGYAVINRDKSEITELYPNWYGTTGEAEPEAFIYDERQPSTFFLFPGVTAGLKLELVYSATPPVRTASEIDSEVNLDSIYSNALIEYMLYMAHSKDFEHSEQAKAQTHFQMFQALMGLKSESDAGMTPTNPANKE